MSVKSGNVENKVRVESIPQFEAGDIVSLTAAALRRRKFRNMTPRLLYAIGHPNEFLVLEAYDHPEDGPCVVLYPCCTYKKDEPRFIDRESGKTRCNGHQASHFEKKSMKRMPKKGDKSTSLHLPFLPFEIAGMHWEEDENNPTLKVGGVGKQISLTGIWAKIAKKIAEDNGVF